MNKIYRIIILSFLLVLSSCLFKNDMSYPRLAGEFTSFDVPEAVSVNIDKTNRRVDIVLNELADITKVNCTYILSDNTIAEVPVPNVLDLSLPFDVVLWTYPDQSFNWTISATQPIDRHIKCSGLISANFDVLNKIALVSLAENQPLENVLINSVKLEPEGSVVKTTTCRKEVNGEFVDETLDCNFPMTLDCVLSREFLVEYKGENIIWKVTFVQTKVENQIKSVNAYAYHAVVKGDFDNEGTPYFEYKKITDDEWTRFTGEYEVNGVSVTADITDLEPATSYEVRLVSSAAEGASESFETEALLQLANMDFEDWSQSGETWFPYAADATLKHWDTANQAVSNVGALTKIYNTTFPETEHVQHGKSAVRMITQAPAGVMAAGNLFSGKFVKFQSMKAYLEWGVPFTSRPHSLKGYYDYSPKIIDKADSKYPYTHLKGETDFMQILVVLFEDSDVSNPVQGVDVGPFSVVSDNPGTPDLKSDPRVIGYATIESDVNTNGQYVEFDLPIHYKDDRKPDYVIVVACASLYGNFFTGGVGSQLYVDNFSFVYK